MANRFWVGGTGTWDSSDTTHWSATSGGAGGASVPGAADDVTFNGSSGGGTVTVNFGGTISVKSITAGAFTGTLDFATNNNSVNIGNFLSWSGSGTRTINMGGGTWTLSGASGSLMDLSNVTGLTFTSSSANIVLSAVSATIRSISLGTSFTYGSLTINANSSNSYTSIAATGLTFGSITINSGNSVGFPQGITTTVSGALTATGSSSAPVGILSSGPGTNAATISVGSASTIDWGGILRITKAGAGSITATNSLDMGGNTGVSISPPSGGGVVGVIGG